MPKMVYPLILAFLVGGNTAGEKLGEKGRN